MDAVWRSHSEVTLRLSWLSELAREEWGSVLIVYMRDIQESASSRQLDRWRWGTRNRGSVKPSLGLGKRSRGSGHTAEARVSLVEAREQVAMVQIHIAKARVCISEAWVHIAEAQVYIRVNIQFKGHLVSFGYSERIYALCGSEFL